ncbi:uncharacterized protein ACBT44_014167 [Syngnathus typhle]
MSHGHECSDHHSDQRLDLLGSAPVRDLQSTPVVRAGSSAMGFAAAIRVPPGATGSAVAIGLRPSATPDSRQAVGLRSSDAGSAAAVRVPPGAIGSTAAIGLCSSDAGPTAAVGLCASSARTCDHHPTSTKGNMLDSYRCAQLRLPESRRLRICFPELPPIADLFSRVSADCGFVSPGVRR